MELKIKDVIGYLVVINLNFENAYKCKNEQENKMLADSWFQILRQYPKEVCDEAVTNALRHAEFAPRIGNIIKEIDAMETAVSKDANQLWAELTGVFKEVNNCIYRFPFTARDEESGLTQGQEARLQLTQIYNGLDPTLKEYLRGENGLREIAEMDFDQQTFERGRFMKRIPQIRADVKLRQQMPLQLRQTVKKLNAQMTLGGDEQKLLGGE